MCENCFIKPYQAIYLKRQIHSAKSHSLTSTPRQIVHEKVYDTVLQRLVKAYAQVVKRTGDPLEGAIS